MKVSIVTPVYNGYKYIRQTIESIQAQRHRNFEHIVMDGLSTDQTVAVVREYPSVRCLSEKDSGQSDALNKGFRLCTGEILAWQNGDDVYFPDTFEKVAAFFQAYPTVDVVYGNYQLMDEKDKWVCDVRPIDWNTWLFAHGRFCPVQPTVFWRRRVYEQVGPLNQNLHFCMDVDFYSRALMKGFRFQRIPETLGKFRVHQESKTQNGENARQVHQEYQQVLASHFAYTWYDHIIFTLFQLRAKVAKGVKQKWWRK